MSTIHRPAGPGHAGTRLDQLPPLTVVTEGIPASEHIEHVEHLERPVVSPAPAAVPAPDTGGRAYQAGVLALLIVVLSSFGYGVRTLMDPPPTNARMGLSDTAWSSYRADERQGGGVVAGFDPFRASSMFTASAR